MGEWDRPLVPGLTLPPGPHQRHLPAESAQKCVGTRASTKSCLKLSSACWQLESHSNTVSLRIRACKGLAILAKSNINLLYLEASPRKNLRCFRSVGTDSFYLLGVGYYSMVQCHKTQIGISFRTKWHIVSFSCSPAWRRRLNSIAKFCRCPQI